MMRRCQRSSGLRVRLRSALGPPPKGLHEMTLLASKVRALVGLRQLLALKIGRIFGLLKESITDFISMKVLKRLTARWIAVF
jgi:hypothetical protein